jgi:drug/metabolite transporter (DMT)-like permease
VNRVLFPLLACFWGGSFVAIKAVVTDVPSSSGAAMRALFGLAALVVIFGIRSIPIRVPRPHLKRLWIAGLFSQTFPFLLLFWGETKVVAGLAGIFNGTVPLWTLIIGFVFLRDVESFTRRKALGLLLGFAGIATIFIPKLRFGGNADEIAGCFALIGMAMCYAIGIVLTRRLQAGRAKIPFQASVFHQQLAAAVSLALIASAIEGPASLWQPWTPRSIGAAAYLGICSNAFGFLIFYHLISAWDAVRASAVTYLVPFVGLVLDYLFYGNIPKSNEIIGVFIIVAGVVLVQGFGAARSVKS